MFWLKTEKEQFWILKYNGTNKKMRKKFLHVAGPTVFNMNVSVFDDTCSQDVCEVRHKV